MERKTGLSKKIKRISRLRRIERDKGKVIRISRVVLINNNNNNIIC